MTFATGVGSVPGSDERDFTEAVRTVLGVLEEQLPFLPEMPGRGPAASMTGRSLAVVADLAADLQPDGWRLTGPGATSGVDHRRARSLLAQDLDTLEEQAQGLTGPFKVQVAGPWTLAATVEKPRGDKVLADHGARRDLAQALAEGVRQHVAAVRRRLPGLTELVVQVDEPVLAAVAAGQVPTASGYGRHRRVDRPELSESLGWVLGAATGAGARAWVHSCAAQVDWPLVVGAGAEGLVLDTGLLTAGDLDTVAESLEAGRTVVLGSLPASGGATPPGAGRLVEQTLRLLESLGLDPDQVGEHLGLTTSCGTAGATAGWSRSVLETAAAAARDL